MVTEIATSTLKLLMECGYLAACEGRTQDAVIVFEGIQAVRPSSELPAVGQGFAYLNAGQFPQAVAVLKNEALKRNPESSSAKAFLGIALKNLGYHDEADRLLAQVIESNDDEAAVRLAKQLIHKTDPKELR